MPKSCIDADDVCQDVEGIGVNDFKQTFDEARDRLVAELYRAVDEGGTDAGSKTDLSVAQVERFADTGFESLRRLTAELLERATELDGEVARLSELAQDAAAALRAGTPVTAPSPERPAAPEPIELPPNLRSLAPESPLDRLEEQQRSIAESPLDFPPPKRRPDDAEEPPVEIRAGVRVIVEHLQIAGEADDVIISRLQVMGVDDPEAVLAQVRAA